MDDLNHQVIRGFGVKAKTVSKHKSFYICNTDRGMMIVKQSVSLSTERIGFQHMVKETLYAGGFENIDRFQLSIDNEPFFVFDGLAYIMTNYISQRETDFGDTQMLREILKQTALMHKTLADAELSCPDDFTTPSIIPEEEYKHSVRELSALKKRLSKVGQLSDFDVILLKNYSYYLELLRDWERFSAKSDIYTTQQNAIKKRYICHNLLKEENIIPEQHGKSHTLYITNFSECAIGHYVLDLASIIKRHFRASAPGEHMSIQPLIEGYTRYNPLDVSELELLKSILIFPDKFLNICTQYSQKKRTWVPGTFISRLENLINRQDEYLEYVMTL